MGARLDGRPGPSSPLWYVVDDRLSVRCLNPECRRAVALPISDLMRCHRLPKDMTLHELWRRLRCIECGRGQPEIDMRDAGRR